MIRGVVATCQTRKHVLSSRSKGVYCYSDNDRIDPLGRRCGGGECSGQTKCLQTKCLNRYFSPSTLCLALFTVHAQQARRWVSVLVAPLCLVITHHNTLTHADTAHHQLDQPPSFMSHFWAFLLVLGIVVLETTAFTTPLYQVRRVLWYDRRSHMTFALPPGPPNWPEDHTPNICTDGHAEQASDDSQDDNDDDGGAS